jgi:cytochrome c peroxidase
MKKFVFIILLLFIVSCDDDSVEIPNVVFQPFQPTTFNIDVPPIFEEKLNPPLIPNSNPLTVEGIALGRKLFYDPILSGDGTQACATCHKQESGLTENLQFSVGIDGISGTRNSMPLFNMAWNFDERFFWDGRAFSQENQATFPVEDPIEMHNTWENAVISLKNSTEYQELFNKAFPEQTDIDTEITKDLTTKAIAQFERTIISADSKFDKFLRGEVTLTADEQEGFNIFNDERGDCFHCHGAEDNNPLWTDNQFRNNGLDATFVDLGLEIVTGDPQDRGKFKTPSLRNLVFTAPYMHDGRFETIDDVIDHYSEGLQDSETIDTFMLFIADGGTQMSDLEKSQLKAFLLTLTDESFLTNPAYSNPN